MQGEYTLQDKEGNNHPLERREVSQATETLGVYIAMDGNDKAQEEALRKKSEDFAEKLRVSKCEPNTALYAYNNCFIKSMEYCMLVTNFTRKKWVSTLGPAKLMALRKSRMSARFPSDALYGSRDYNFLFSKNRIRNKELKKL